MSGMLSKLKMPFDPAKVSWRVGSTTQDKTRGMALAYIDARDVMERLDEVCTPGGWEDSYTETAKGRILCTIRIKIDGEWVSKSDGAGDTDVEGDKGAVSDAFKRAAVKWGIGRYLYDVESPWVPLVKSGNSYKIDPNASKELARALGGAASRAREEAPKPEETPFDDEPRMSPDEYIAKATAIIRDPKRTQDDVREWWQSEATARRSVGLSQDHVNILKHEIELRFPQKKDAA